MRALLLVLALAACTSEGPTDLARIGALAIDAVEPAEPAPLPTPSRADLEATGAAILAVSAEGATGYVAAVSETAGDVTYQDAAGRALVLRGAAVARTHGFGHDLTGLRVSRADPLAHPRPLADWPGQIDREYRFRVRNGAPYSIVLTCLYNRGERSRIEILGRLHITVAVEERCANRHRSVVNRHWVAPATGRIWRSQQWIGPHEAPLTLEVVTPYAARARW